MPDEHLKSAARSGAPKNEPELTLDLTGAEQSHFAHSAFAGKVIPAQKSDRGNPELEIYDQKKQWDSVRKIVTLGLLAMLGWVIVWASIESASWPSHWAQTKEMLQTILPAITGLLGSVIGFYFGSNTNSNAAGKSGIAGTDSGNGK